MEGELWNGICTIAMDIGDLVVRVLGSATAGQKFLFGLCWLRPWRALWSVPSLGHFTTPAVLSCRQVVDTAPVAAQKGRPGKAISHRWAGGKDRYRGW
jgi:hypothetical protein